MAQQCLVTFLLCLYDKYTCHTNKNPCEREMYACVCVKYTWMHCASISIIDCALTAQCAVHTHVSIMRKAFFFETVTVTWWLFFSKKESLFFLCAVGRKKSTEKGKFVLVKCILRPHFKSYWFNCLHVLCRLIFYKQSKVPVFLQSEKKALLILKLPGTGGQALGRWRLKILE